MVAFTTGDRSEAVTVNPGGLFGLEGLAELERAAALLETTIHDVAIVCVLVSTAARHDRGDLLALATGSMSGWPEDVAVAVDDRDLIGGSA